MDGRRCRLEEYGLRRKSFSTSILISGGAPVVGMSEILLLVEEPQRKTGRPSTLSSTQIPRRGHLSMCGIGGMGDNGRSEGRHFEEGPLDIYHGKLFL